MCPLYPFHVVLLYLCLLLPLLLAVVEGAESLASWKLANLTFSPNRYDKLPEGNVAEAQLSCYDCALPSDLVVRLKSLDKNVAGIDYQAQQPDQQGQIELIVHQLHFDDADNWSLMFNITPRFLGFTKIVAEIQRDRDVLLSQEMPVSVVRKKTVQAKLFSYAVAILISLAYVNMGCALDLQVVRQTLRRPIGPAIGFVCQFLFMPLIAFALGFLFPASDAAMRLGLFVTGTSPGGGASNIWTLMFCGNLDLSVTMTAISTFASFFMMPFWIFTLGRVIFQDGDIVIPYYKICVYAFCLVVPLSIGILIAKFLPRVSAFLVRILKPMALFLILFILVFGVWANLYIFRLMTWQVFLAGMGLPWIGFAFGCMTARLFRRSREDVIAIAIETGIQNTGVAIFILWFTLDQPLGDMTAVIPVAAATMTPLPLLVALGVAKLRLYCQSTKLKDAEQLGHNEEQDDLKESEARQALMSKAGCSIIKPSVPA